MSASTRSTGGRAMAVFIGVWAGAMVALAIILLLFIQPARAGDLGGTCCQDLEERVADLEATVARKGNRKMSLSVSGQVSRSILYWNDGTTSDTYVGLDNHNQSTRFVFSGSAKVNQNLSAGFEFMTEISAGARTSAVNQADADGGASSDSALAVRTANWWLESNAFGRVTVGRINFGGPVATIDLGGISTAAGASPGLVGGGFVLYDIITPVTLAHVVGPTYGGDRVEGVRWDSQSFGGFILQSSWGEDDVWSAAIRYAGEAGGFRVAAGVGYQRQDLVGQLDTSAVRGEAEWSGSVALMHLQSGLFAQGQYSVSEFMGGADATFYLGQAGISKNWFGPGNTSFYGEYGRAEGYRSGTGSLPFGWSLDSDVQMYGAGIVQQLDAASMEVFVGWRRFESDVMSYDAGGVLQNTESDVIDFVHGGARVKF